MKFKIIQFALVSNAVLLFSQNTQTRDNAGLQGDQGALNGVFETLNPTNYPAGATSWWHLLDVRHSNTANNYAMQFSGSFFDQQLYFRKTNNLASQPWRKILMEDAEGNVGIGITNPQAILDVYKNATDDSNKIIGFFRREGTPTGGSSIFRIGYHDTADLEVNSGYASTGWRYGFYTDLNIVNNKSGGSYGSINFVTNSKVQMTVGANGNTAVHGKLEAKEIKVTTTPTADFVFEADYNLPKLEDVEKHIQEKKHLPEIASAEEMQKEGVNVGEFQIKLLQKIEELTLYIIIQEKRIKELEHKQTNKI